MMLDLSKVWPEWTAEEKLGEGAYGSVYKCVRRERGITSYCAIKVITVPHDSSELDSLKLEGYTDETSKEYFNDIVDNFANEISVMENLKGFPNIVSVEDFKIIEHADNVGWDIYIRMELLTSFKQYLENNSMTQREALKLGKDICTALEICEKNGIIHRDIKADNIFIDKSGNFKLGDFGVARQLERTRSTMSRKGTYAYMAPEVAINGKYDKRADIYSLGMVMYKLLNKNRDPFLDTEKQMIRYQERVDSVNRRLNGEALPKPVNADDAVAEIILKACKFNKEERFASATEMKSAIENILAPKKEPETSAEVQAIVRKEIAEEVKPEDIKAEKSETKIITAPSKSSKINKKAVGIIAAAVAVIVIAGVFAFGMINKKENKDSSTTTLPVAQSPDINEEELYKAYLNSEEGRNLYLTEKPSEDVPADDWTGAEDIYYIDIDNDNIDECFIGIEFKCFDTDMPNYYFVSLLDIKDDKVAKIYTSDSLSVFKATVGMAVTLFEGEYYISEASWYSKTGSSGTIYKYDGNSLSLVKSMVEEVNYFGGASDHFWISDTQNIHKESIDSRSLNGDMVVSEKEYRNAWNQMTEGKLILSYGLVDDGMGRFSAPYETTEALHKIFTESEYFYSGADSEYVFCDYNNDGKFEMMLYQYFPIEDSVDEFSGDMYLITENGIEDIMNDVRSVNVFESGRCYNNGRWFFTFGEGFVTGNGTRMFAVVDGKIKEVTVSYGFRGGYLENEDLYGIALSFDTMGRNTDGFGHTYKQYYFYWDENSQSFKEYGAIEITQDQFLKCKGAKEILDEAKNKGYVINDILYRGNGIININYVIDDYDLENINLMLESDGSLTVLHDGYSGIDGNNGFGGNYELAACPEIAIYPYKFPL